MPTGSHPHDVAPAAEGGVWYTAQATGKLGHLDPLTGNTREADLGSGSAPHGVIVGADGAAWVTDGGLNAIVRVDPHSLAVSTYAVPSPSANLNTATFDGGGRLWFTGQSGIYGRLDVVTGKADVFNAPKGGGSYGIDSCPDGTVWFASLAGSYIARIDVVSGAATVVEPPTSGQGARRVWCDSKSRVWVSEWNAGQVAMYEPASGAWKEWRLPGARPQAYAVFVDDADVVWLTDFGANAIVRFDPTSESFTPFPLPSPSAEVRQLLGRHGGVWGAESGTDKLVRVSGAPR